MVTPNQTLGHAIDTYERHKLDLLQQGLAGKWVLVHEQRVVDTYGSRDDCLRDGYRRFGNTPFLVREILESRDPLVARSVRFRSV